MIVDFGFLKGRALGSGLASDQQPKINNHQSPIDNPSRLHAGGISPCWAL
jgi:hypothetical protein